ncbi:MAG TPA: hypothetical protein VGB85_13880, partial [Nannocystis sp.]
LLYADATRCFFLEGDLYRGFLAHLRATALFQAQGNRHWHAVAMLLLGQFQQALGRPTVAAATLREARALALACGTHFYATIHHLHLGMWLASETDATSHAEARAIAETYVGRTDLGPAIAGASESILAAVAAHDGDLDAAASAAARAVASFVVMLPYRLVATALLVDILLQLGRVAEAREAAEDALRALAVEGGAGYGEVELHTAVLAARLADGDRDGARLAAQTALAALQRRIDAIDDPELRADYEALPGHRRLVALAAASRT